jgi:hypothetical protein
LSFPFTALEQGLADVDADGWNALFLPKGTPEPVIRRLNAATSAALDNSALVRRMDELGLTARRRNGAPRGISPGCCGWRSRNERRRSRRAASARIDAMCDVAT